MRFDTPVYFQKILPGEYEESTGDYKEENIEEKMRYADVTDAGTDMLKLVYGELRQGCRVIRLQTHYDLTFDRIRIGIKSYRVNFSRRLKNKQIFIVSEVQGCQLD